ncbi:hypothetical protein BDV12DRAFT_199115 [Aspergillus spectabilis]
MSDDSFQLYDLRVEVVCPEGKRILCGGKTGDYFTLKGEMMYLPPGQGISIYSLDAVIACPDPHCPSQLKIVRTGVTVFKHSETTAEPLNSSEPKLD